MSHTPHATSFIATLPERIQTTILERLTLVGLTPDLIEVAMNSRLADLNETIDISDLV